MENEPKTATQILMQSHEDRRLEIRDRQVAMSSAAQAADEWFKPEEIEDMSDVRRIVARVAEYAAYLAIQKERELHLGDMAALRSWMEAKATEIYFKPLQTVISAPKAQ